MNLSENFSLREFTDHHDKELTPAQIFMLRSLCMNILQPIREYLGCPMKVTNGYRPLDNFHRLLEAGYWPSETSDHSLGDQIPLRDPNKLERFGKFYSYSVGAGDIIPAIGAREALERLRHRFNADSSTIDLPSGKVKVGQLIYEKGKWSEWLHISNPATLVYSEVFADRFLSKTPFLISLENGKPGSYQVIT